MQNNSAFDYPQEPILLVRPCLVVICRENRPAAKLLSGLLYHARNCSQEQEIFIYQRKQEDLVKIDLCGEISVKTLHDTAIPALKLLGFIEVDESSYVMRYTIYLARIREALAAYKQGKVPLEKVLIVWIKQQLEKVLIQLEKFLIDKKNFQLLLEKFLIVIRKSSNCRGRKANGENALEAPEINRDNRDNIRDIRESIETSHSVPYVPDFSQGETKDSYSPKGPTPSPSTSPSADYGKEEKSPQMDEVRPSVQTQVLPRSTNQPARSAPRMAFSLPELSPKAILDMQIDQALGWLDSVRIETLQDKRAGYVKTDTARKDIAGLIKGGAILTEESVRRNWLALYNRPPSRNFDFKKNLTIRAFCNNFDNALVCTPASRTAPSLPSTAHLSDDEYHARLSIRRK